MNEARIFTGDRRCRAPSRINGFVAAKGCGRRAAEDVIWHAGVQQSIFEWSTGLCGILPSIAHPGVVPLGAAAALAVTGASASPSAQKMVSRSRIVMARKDKRGRCRVN